MYPSQNSAFFSSSAAVYGNTGGEPAREDMMPKPMSHYAVQKLASEHYCQVYQRLHGLETVCLRYFNVYGPRQRADSPYSEVIAKFIDAVRAGNPIQIFGDGEQTRDFCHVKDVAAANYLTAAECRASAVSGLAFNIGTGRSLAVLELASAIGTIFPATPEACQVPGRRGEIKHSRADIKQAHTLLSWQPTIHLEDDLEQLAKK